MSDTVSPCKFKKKIFSLERSIGTDFQTVTFFVKLNKNCEILRMWYLDSRGSTEVGIGLEAGTRRVSSSQEFARQRCGGTYVLGAVVSQDGFLSVQDCCYYKPLA